MSDAMSDLLVSRYRTIVFDCDGVLLNSNRIKTDAFYKAALSYGTGNAKALVDYHVRNGGISRYDKFRYFLKHIIGKVGNYENELIHLLNEYSSQTSEGLMLCEIAGGLNQLREQTRNACWIVVSGGAQDELRRVFSRRGLSGYFDGGIFGSPDSKDEILSREIECKNILPKALFVGDSRYDYEASDRTNLDFIFVSGWTEFEEYKEYFKDKNVNMVSSLNEIMYLAAS